MTGKVFAESANIYEDQARVLFDYYKKAAEKIIEEEVGFEKRIERCKKIIEDSSKVQKIGIIVSIASAVLAGLFSFLGLTKSHGFFILTGLSVLGLADGLFLLIKNKRDLKKATEDIANYSKNKDAIRRDYKVSKVGVAYVPVATKVPFEGKSFVVNHTGGIKNTDFELAVIHKPDELQKSLSELEQGLNNIPVVEGNENAEEIDTSNYSLSVQKITMHDYMGNIDRQVRNISYLLHDSDIRSVSLPVIAPGTPEDEFINEFATTDTENKPVVKVFETDGFDDKLKTFNELRNLKKQLESTIDENNSEYFKRLIRKLGDSVQIVSKIKTSATSKLLDYTTSILSAVLKSGYNQYSPAMEAEELQRIREANFNYEECVENYKPFELKESSKVKYEIFSRTWVAEDNTRTNMPFGINQIEEEVLMPLINNLMMETRVERLKIYNNIKDQKLSYLNKWHQDVEAAFRDNRKSGQDLITQITNAYSEYSTAHNTYLSYKETQDSMNAGQGDGTEEVSSEENAIAELEQKVESCRQVGDAFQVYINDLQKDINESSEKFGFVEYFEASLRDTESRNIARSIVPENLQNLEPRRQKLVGINSYVASYADLPPVPQVEEKLAEDFSMDLQQVAASQLYKIETASQEEKPTGVPAGDQGQEYVSGKEESAENLSHESADNTEETTDKVDGE